MDIAGIQRRIEELEGLIAICEEYNHDPIDMQLELQELEDELRFAWQENEIECNYHAELINDKLAEGLDPFDAQEYADSVLGW